MSKDFKIGDQVLVIKSSLQSYKLVGTIVDTHVENYPNSVLIEFPNWHGQINKILYMNKENIAKVSSNKEETNMSKLTGFKKVAVINIGNIDYHYALYDEDIQVGDKVLVSGSCGRIVEISDIITAEEVKEKFNKNITAEVKCKVDLSAYEQRIKNREEAEKLKKKMDEEIKKMDEMNKYAMYANSNPALAEMLNQYKELVG